MWITSTVCAEAREAMCSLHFFYNTADYQQNREHADAGQGAGSGNQSGPREVQNHA